MTDRNNIISSDYPLSEPLRECLLAFVATVIPAGDDGRMPPGDETDIFLNLPQEAAPIYEQGLPVLGDGFAHLSAPEREATVRALHTEQPELMTMLIGQTFALYYMDDAVLVGLGLEARPPHPGGYDVGETDWGLLEPVKQRDKLYRDA